MGLSARTDDLTGLPIGEGYVRLATSAGNGLVFANPANANFFLQANPGQFIKAGTSQTTPDGDFNDQSQAPAQS